MGFVFTTEGGQPVLSIAEDWYPDLREVLETISADDGIAEKDMQIDHRHEITREE